MVTMCIGTGMGAAGAIFEFAWLTSADGMDVKNYNYSP
jgi:hypothetical protein